MAKHRPWSPKEEAELSTLVESNTELMDIAGKLQRSPGSIIIKSQRLGLKLKTKGYVTTSVVLPRELPSVEEALKLLAGALKTAATPGLDRVEVQRLQALATISKTYKEILVDYINYREIERQLKEAEQLNVQLLKERAASQVVSAQPNTVPIPELSAEHTGNQTTTG